MICFVRYYLYTKNAAMYHFIIFLRMEVIMSDFILLNEDFSDFPIGEFPYDKNHSAMGEYHFIHYPGYYGKWYDPVCNQIGRAHV